MVQELLNKKLDSLAEKLDGDLKYDTVTRTIYSTDASVYREMPLAVAWPKGVDDIRKIVLFASEKKTSVTVRAAGTSLAGQVVGSGIIMDISRHMNRILEINMEERWVRTEPGVILDELNMALKETGLFFGPETSTSSRCNIGGMVGNNACGSHSLIYGSTRDHTISLKCILSDGSEAEFGPVDKVTFRHKCMQENLEGVIYRNIRDILSDPGNRRAIREGYPDPAIPRRNTGYALDLLLDSEIFDNNNDERFNFCNLLTGSEGTLAVITEIKLNLVPLPPPCKALVCVHLKGRNEAFRANLTALKFRPSAVEMMDNRILELTESNISQRNNRFFLDEKPGAIVIVEFCRDTPEDTDRVIDDMIQALRSSGYGYAYPVIRGNDIKKVWDLRKAGLGILGNMPGDAKPVSLIEDTAVKVEDLPEYISDFEEMLSRYGKDVVYHAHIGTGELHMRPVLNLKDKDDAELFRTLGHETALLVRKYRGSMSGEHGDGRLRGEFIPLIIGDHNYDLLKSVKRAWDPEGILNPGKITDTPVMNTSLRYKPGEKTRDIETIFDFSASGGIIRAAEKCNGSGDCRKTAKTGGTMCPSYMATGDERNTTRARANILREFLSTRTGDPWDNEEIFEILDLCLSCKGCKSECPSGVDIALLKSEFLQHWYDRHGVPLRTWMIAHISSFNKAGSLAPGIYNFFLRNRLISSVIRRIGGFSEKRSIPLLYSTTLRMWAKRNLDDLNPRDPAGSVVLFADEFTDLNDTLTGITAIKLLTSLNYRVTLVNHEVSARTFISKGLIRKARRIVRNNIEILSDVISAELPLIGIEPSAILGFRDEYPGLAGSDLREKAEKLSVNCLMIDEFISGEFRKGKIRRDMFTTERKNILLHAHCQQKAVSSPAASLEMLSIPEGYSVTEIPSGCCGMAGSFGYEKEHYELSNMIGELILFPEIRESAPGTIIAAPGTSCRHHIKEGTGRSALHPAEILYNALID